MKNIERSKKPAKMKQDKVAANEILIKDPGQNKDNENYNMKSPTTPKKDVIDLSPPSVKRPLGQTTPKRRKDALSSLETTLSPKYTNFSCSEPSLSGNSFPEIRRSRQKCLKKNANSGSPTDNSVEGDIFFPVNVVGCIRRTSKNLADIKSPISSSSSPSPSRKTSAFESPIEKLLRRNGSANISTSPPKPADVFSSNLAKKIDRKERMDVIVTLERLPSLTLMQATGATTDSTLSEAICTEISDKTETADIQVNVDQENHSKSKDENVSQVGQTDFETTNLNEKSLHPQSDIVTNNNNVDIHDEVPAAKSPSTLSVDSAKGSSIDTEGEISSWAITGDLFWGQIFQYCYWPCMVCPDPDNKTISFSDASQQFQHIMIHVRFFADNARRSWVKKDNLLPYKGLENYHKKMEDVLAKYGKKSSKYKVFLVSKSKLKLWQQAVNEAEEVLLLPQNDRLEHFFQIFENVREQFNLKRKRRQSMFSNTSATGTSLAVPIISSETDVFDLDNNLRENHSTKRQRSPTPASPLYSPLKSKNLKKIRKIDGEAEEFEEDISLNSTVTSTETETNQNKDVEKPEAHGSTLAVVSSKKIERLNENADFEKFFKGIKMFVMKNNTDPAIEREVKENVQNLWALKHLSQHQSAGRTVQTEECTQEISGRNKRLSQRVRNLVFQRILPPEANLKPAKTSVEKPKKPATLLTRPIDEVINDIFELDNKYLFHGLAIEPVCKYCQKSDTDLQKCSKNCNSWVHFSCTLAYKEANDKLISVEAVLANESAILGTSMITNIDVKIDSQNETIASITPIESVICDECAVGETAKCFVCNRNNPDLEQLTKCNNNKCRKVFHPKCLRYWPQAKLTMSAKKIESLRCPAHVCHTCVSDNPKGKFLYSACSELTKCIKCPATYHMDSTCIPAGSQILTASCIICPRHNTYKTDPLINVNWCFICVSGGKLICCETCPTAVHPECLNIPVVPEEGYICEECETGRMPLYGEMVWAKFNNFRWWPAIILPPTEIPENLQRKVHNPFEFVVRFFGTNDHAWISRRRVYLYQEGDCCEPPRTNKKGLDHTYMRGVEEAKRINAIIKDKKLQQLSTVDKKQRISPLPYVKIKVNRAVPPVKLQVNLEKISQCDCSKNSENPCGPDTDCLNRVLFTECNPKICPAGTRCQNQMFESRIYPKLDVVYMNERGFGLVCREPIKQGTFVIEYVGEVIDDAEFRRRIAEKELERDENFYFLTLEKDYIIDAGPKGNMARFMNHSCEPNCETQKWSVNGLDRIGLFAIQDIPINTELTFNYYWDELLGNDKKICHCGASKCAGQIGGKYKEPIKLPEIRNNIPGTVKRKKLVSTKIKSTVKQQDNQSESNKILSNNTVKVKNVSRAKKDAKRTADSKRNKTELIDIDFGANVSTNMSNIDQ